MNRYCTPFIKQDLAQKMVFLGGPRQVGKTTLAKGLLKDNWAQGQYFNWDVDEDRKAILKKEWKSNAPLVIFDELHKYTRWKQWIKGVYDARPEEQEYLVTGSARLDVYKRGGDSLVGRYHYWRLHPFTLDEFPNDISAQEAYQRLLTVGGFPEPFIVNDEREARRWRRERFDRILREDVRDLESIRHISLLSIMADSLKERVGSNITLSNIARDLEIAPNTAKHWLQLLERMYLVFAIYPYTTKIARSLIKPPKVYFYDNADVADDEGARLENLIATTLLKRIHFTEDYHGFKSQLHYIRDKEGREVDFVVTKNNVVELLIEVKLSDTTLSRSLQYYADLLQPKEVVQIVGNLKKPFTKNNILVTNPIDYFTQDGFVFGE
ncbi:MAG: ATP-binding protein [Legionellales bacterium]|jgi:hypothetical protein